MEMFFHHSFGEDSKRPTSLPMKGSGFESQTEPKHQLKVKEKARWNLQLKELRDGDCLLGLPQEEAEPNQLTRPSADCPTHLPVAPVRAPVRAWRR